jgi:hypothetical protein
MLYQLFDNQFKQLGNGFVQIDAPFEKYGKLLSGKRENGTFLIRGIGNKKPSIY